jgi:hypothetical protein
VRASMSSTNQKRTQLKPGDIVKHDESPCEVLCVFAALDLVFIMNKRTLCAQYLHPAEVEFVRRPEAKKRGERNEPQTVRQVRKNAAGERRR